MRYGARLRGTRSGRLLLPKGLARRTEAADNEFARKQTGSVTYFKPVPTPTVRT